MLVVFDLDGTLVDSRRDLADASNAMLRSYGAESLDEEVVGRMVGEGAAVLVERLLAARALDVGRDEALERFLAAYDARLTAHTRPYDGIPEALEAASGFAVLAVLTNKPSPAASRMLDELGLARWFWRVLGGNSGFPRKPDPGALLHLASEAGVPPSRAMLVGDSLVDVRTARSAGVHLCVACYGFGFESIPQGELGAGEFSAAHPADIIAALQALRRGSVA